MPQFSPTPEFANLLTGHQRQLFGYVSNFFPCPDDAEEVLQQVNVVLWSKAGDFQPGTSFHAWALRVAHYEVLAQLNRKRRDRRVFSAELLDIFSRELSDEASDPFAAVRHWLRECLAHLPVLDRELVERHYIAGVPVKQLATELGRKQNSIYRSLNRVRNRLLVCIEEHELRERKAHEPSPPGKRGEGVQ